MMIKYKQRMISNDQRAHTTVASRAWPFTYHGSPVRIPSFLCDEVTYSKDGSWNRREILFWKHSSVSSIGLDYYHLSADTEHLILQISNVIVLIDEIRNESKSLVDNQVLLSEIESFKPNRSSRSCEKVKLSDSKDTRQHLYNMTLQSTSLYIGGDRGKIQWKTIKFGKKFYPKWKTNYCSKL